TGGKDESFSAHGEEALGLFIRQDRGRAPRPAARCRTKRLAGEPWPAEEAPHPGVCSLASRGTAPLSLALLLAGLRGECHSPEISESGVPCAGSRRLR